MSSGGSVKDGVKKKVYHHHTKLLLLENRLEKEQNETSEKTIPVFVEVTPTAPLQIDNFRSSLHIA